MEPKLSLREIDRLVAEKAAGFFRLKYGDREILVSPNFTLPEADARGFFDIREVIPAYSTNIAAAWLVVVNMQARTESAEVYLRQSYDGMWMCSFFGKGTVQYQGTAHADTAPLAISLAALKAFGVEVQP